MATAAAYDEYEDVGLAFSEEEVSEFSFQTWAEAEVTELGELVRVLTRVSQIPNAPKARWCTDAAKLLMDRITWFCRVAEIEGISRDEVVKLPEPKSAEGKALSVLAQKAAADLDDWCAEHTAAANDGLRWLVTMGRRANTVQRFGKAERSKGNKLVNALIGECSTWEKLSASLLATTKAAK